MHIIGIDVRVVFLGEFVEGGFDLFRGRVRLHIELLVVIRRRSPLGIESTWSEVIARERRAGIHDGARQGPRERMKVDEHGLGQVSNSKRMLTSKKRISSDVCVGSSSLASVTGVSLSSRQNSLHFFYLVN